MIKSEVEKNIQCKLDYAFISKFEVLKYDLEQALQEKLNHFMSEIKAANADEQGTKASIGADDSFNDRACA